MSNKLVSVIIPNYNSIKFIEETLDSVFNQTHKKIELIVVDDGSSDGSFEWISNLDDPNIQLVKNPSKGACAARNHGLRIATGDYIQFLDADDILSRDKIEKQVKALNNSEDQIAVCNTFHFTNAIEENICTDKPYVFSTSNPEELFINLWGGNDLTMNMIANSAWLAPRALIDKCGIWDETLAKDQDGEFFARLGLQSSGIIYVPEVKNYYRKHNSGKNIASQKKEVHLKSMLNATDLKAKYLFAKTQSNGSKRAIATQYKHVAIDAWPQYRTVYKTAISKCEALGGSNYNPVLGGRLIEGIKNTLGWRRAKSFAYYGRKYLNR